MSDTIRWCFTHRSQGFDTERISWCMQVDRMLYGPDRAAAQEQCEIVEMVPMRVEWEATIDYEAIATEIQECFDISRRLALHLAERFVRAGTGSREELDEWMARRNAAVGEETP